MFYHLFLRFSFFIFCAGLYTVAGNDTPRIGNMQAPTVTAWTADWSHDDRFVAVGNSNGDLSVYDAKGWKKIKSWNFKGATITRIEWNPKFAVLAVAAFWHGVNPSVVQLYDAEKGTVLQTLPDSVQGRALSWSPDGEAIAYAGRKGCISIYTKTGRLRKSLSFTNTGSLFDIDWHPAKNILLAVEENIYLLDIDRDSLLATYDDGTKNKGILSCQWHPSGSFFVTGDYGHEQEGGQPSYLKYWSIDGDLRKQTSESRFEYRNLRWRRDGKYLAAAGDALLIFDGNGGLVRRTKFDGNNLWGLSWNHKGDKIISSDGAGAVRITTVDGKILKMFAQ
jgi:WD40 repeat protein